MTSHTSRFVIDRDCRVVLAGVRQISEIQQDQRTRTVILREMEAKQRRVVRSSHINPDPRFQLYGEVSRVGLDRIGFVFYLSLVLWIHTAIQIVASTLGMGKKREVAQ